VKVGIGTRTQLVRRYVRAEPVKAFGTNIEDFFCQLELGGCAWWGVPHRCWAAWRVIPAA
jgi:hypothetical protein